MTASGEPMYAYYCRKFKPWYDADQRVITESAHAKRQSIIKNQHDGTAGTAADEPDKFYIPAEAKHAIAATEQRERRILRSSKG